MDENELILASLKEYIWIGQDVFFVLTAFVIVWAIFSYIIPKTTSSDFFSKQNLNILQVATMIMIALLILSIGILAPFIIKNKPLISALIYTLSGPTVLIGLWLFFRLKLRQSMTVLGISSHRWLEKILLGLKWAFGYQFFLFGLRVIVIEKMKIQEPPAWYAKVVAYYISTWGISSGVFILVCALIFGAAAEEILFRGMLYSVLRKQVRPIAANITSSLVFMLGHGLFDLSSFIFACTFAYLYEKTHSLLPSTITHITCNLFNTLFFVVRYREGIDLQPFLQTSILILGLGFLFFWGVQYFLMKKSGKICDYLRET